MVKKMPLLGRRQTAVVLAVISPSLSRMHRTLTSLNLRRSAAISFSLYLMLPQLHLQKVQLRPILLASAPMHRKQSLRADSPEVRHPFA